MPAETSPNTEISSLVQAEDGLSRRDFLKVLGAGAGAVALSSVPQAVQGAVDTYAQETDSIPNTAVSEIVTPEIKLEPTVRTVDFFDLHPVINEQIRTTFLEGFSEEEAFSRMGVKDPNTSAGLLEAIPHTADDTRLLVAKYFEQTYGSHGKQVQDVMNRVALATSGRTSANPQSSSIATAVSFGGVERDLIGNTKTKVSISADAVNDVIEEIPDSIINMSFEVGEFEVFHNLYERKSKDPDMKYELPSTTSIGNHATYKDYKGNPITGGEYAAYKSQAAQKETIQLDVDSRYIRQVDGYAGDEALVNLGMLVDIARAHPNKVFVAANGNPTYLQGQGLKIPDTREGRELFKSKDLWPDNLIMVGVEATESGYVGPASEGADIYVSDRDLVDELGVARASSFAAATVSEISRQLVEKGHKSPSQLKKALYELTQNAGESNPYRLLDFDKAKETLKS